MEGKWNLQEKEADRLIFLAEDLRQNMTEQMIDDILKM